MNGFSIMGKRLKVELKKGDDPTESGYHPDVSAGRGGPL